MGVFLRWGVFGILAVAALMYAYNASKRLAESRPAAGPKVVSVAPFPAPDAAGSAPEDPAVPAPAHCEKEMEIALIALQARRERDPLDRLLRKQAIAFETDPVRRARLEKVATYWYSLQGDEPMLDEVRASVIANCRRFSPAP
jgi:hypothetical protein